MGILDDAIREHLDLKRRQGAEDEELDKLESEAFGPPSRPGDPEFGEPGPDVLPTGEQALVLEAPADVSPVETGDQPAVAELSPGLFDHSADEPEAPSPITDESESEPEASEAEAEAPPKPEPVEEPEPVIESFDTVEHHFEGAIEETGEAEVVEGELEPEGHDDAPLTDDEDVLEETPEFLRDQPDDDELWFEQGEPKDFDF